MTAPDNVISATHRISAEEEWRWNASLPYAPLYEERFGVRVRVRVCVCVCARVCVLRPHVRLLIASRLYQCNDMENNVLIENVKGYVGPIPGVTVVALQPQGKGPRQR